MSMKNGILARLVTVLLALPAAGCFLLAVYKKGPASAEAAAWAQAILTALAVFVAWWLQKGLLEGRDKADCVRRLEAIAAVAGWVLTMYRQMMGRAQDGVPTTTLIDVIRPAELQEATQALRALRVAEVGDGTLTTAHLNLLTQFEHARIELQRRREHATMVTSMVPLQGHQLVAQFETPIFNAAASVERRVAQLVGRLPKL